MVVHSIPVKVHGWVIYTYELCNLFSKWGNGDGDDGFLCLIASKIIEQVEKLGYEVDTGWGIHNCHGIFELSRGGTVLWGNKFATDDVWRDSVFVNLWETLPEDVRKLFERLESEGVEI